MVFRDKGPRQNLRTETFAMASEIAYLGLNEKKATTQHTIQVKWLWPPINWFKVNSDGSSLGNPGIVGGGGLIRNENGEWVRGYARAVGATTSVIAELWALRNGIRLCIALNLQAVIFELDAKLVVDLLSKDERLESGNDTILLDYRKGLGDIPMVRIQHCYREANKCADALARRGAWLSQDFVIFLDPPLDVSLLLSLDAIRTLYDHNVSAADHFV